MDTVRILTLNLWGDQGPWEARSPVLAAGIEALAPDVILLQEVRSVPGKVPNQAEQLAHRFGYHWCFAVATSWGGGDEGLAILANLPIAHTAHRELPHPREKERRVLVGAGITTPYGELAVFTTHLHYRLGDGVAREDQVWAVDGFVRDWQQERPTELPRILGGDFNATPDHDELRFLRGLHTLHGRRTVWQDAWLRLHPGEPGCSWSAANHFTDSLHFLDRERRLDYLFVSPVSRDHRGEILSCRLALTSPSPEGVFASDHFGVIAEVRLAGGGS